MGERFGPYELMRLLGRGGMGEVHAALDTEQERTVALKRLLPHLADDEEFQKRFRRESRLAARLSSPHVIPIHRSGEIDGRLFIDMRLVEGQDLEQLLAQDVHLEPARVVTVIEHVASALDAAHHAGLIHRDVKPSNVLLDAAVGARDFVYLVDFGITRAFGDESQALTGTHAVVGSLDYMAPEQFEGVAEPSIDVYSLGCLLYQALTGSRPFPLEGFPALMRAHLSLPAPAPSVLRPALGTAFDEVVACALAKDPRERYPSAGALAAAARAALETAAGAGTDRWAGAVARRGSATELPRSARTASPSPSRSQPGPPRPVPARPSTGRARPVPASAAADPLTSTIGGSGEPVTSTLGSSGEPVTSTLGNSGEPVTSTLGSGGPPVGTLRPPVGSAPPRPSPAVPGARPAPPPAPPVGRAHPSFPYPSAPPPAPLETPQETWPTEPEDAAPAPARSSAGRRLGIAVALVLVLVVGVLVGRIAVVWATTGVSPLDSLLGAAPIAVVVPAPAGATPGA